MKKAIIGKKVGMTQIFDEKGNVIPVTVIEKTYIVQVKGSVSQNEIEKLQKGIKIENYVTRPAKVKLINSNENTSELEIIIHEGKNRSSTYGT